MNWSNLIIFLMNNPCEDPNILKVILFIKKIMEVAFIAVPIVLIVLITFDFIKSVTAASEDAMKKNQKIVIKRLVYAVLLFFVMPIVNIVFSAFDSSGNKELYGWDGVNYLTCWTNASDVETIEEIFEKKAIFKGNGGTVFGDKEKSCGGYDSCELNSLSRASKKGFTFKGWSSSEECSGTPVNKITLVKKTTTLYACYEKNSTDSSSGTVSGVASDWWWPIQKGSNGEPLTTNVSSKYGKRNVAQSTFHYGIDISKGNSPEIIASYDGVIDTIVNSYTGTTKKPNYGNYIIIKHIINGTTYYSYYAHMAPKSIPSNLKVGDSIAAGTVVGKMGQTGYSFGVHLHFEIRKNSKDYNARSKNAIDPLTFIDTNNPYPVKQESVQNVPDSSDSAEGYADTSKTTTMLVNNWNVIKDNNWEPTNLEKVGKNYVVSGKEDIMLQKEAAEQVRKLIDAAKKDGVTLKVISGYRNYDYQYNRKYVQNNGKDANNPLVAEPNATEHRTGLAVDFNEATNWGKWINNNEKAWNWLNKNAKNYGFILRYPLGSEDKTGIGAESWHWRYIGKTHAESFYEVAADKNTATNPKDENKLKAEGDQDTNNTTLYYKFSYEEYYQDAFIGKTY